MCRVNELKKFTRGQLDVALMKIGLDAGMGTADGIVAFLAGRLTVSKSSHHATEIADYAALAQFVTPDGTITLENFRKCLAPQWREENGVIYFSVTSDGTTGCEWIKLFGFHLDKRVRQILLSPDFKPTTGVTTQVAVLKGRLFGSSERVTGKIRTAAYAGTFTRGQKLFDPNAELAYLIRRKFMGNEIEEMGLRRIVVMHEPVSFSDCDSDDSNLLCASLDDDDDWVRACSVLGPGDQWRHDSGFAFAISSISDNAAIDKQVSTPISGPAAS